MEKTPFLYQGLASLAENAKMLCRTLFFGLWVLIVEMIWLCGADLMYWRQLRILNQQLNLLNDELAQMVTLADPKQEQLRKDVTLLEGDISKIEHERAQRHEARLQTVRLHLQEFIKTRG